MNYVDFYQGMVNQLWERFEYLPILCRFENII